MDVEEVGSRSTKMIDTVNKWLEKRKKGRKKETERIQITFDE